ncbi:MAG TPA: diguanylate cyclase [Chitinispirillaceae bacterium]|nr:diguanylate cyclase [Chitinispirillaceae bacterium]
MTYPNIIPTILEFFLFSALSGLSLLGYADGLLSEIPHITYLNGLPLLILFGAAGLILSISPTSRISLNSAYGISALTFTLIHMSTIPESQNSLLLSSPLIYIVITGIGVMSSSNYSWIIPFLVFVVANLAYVSLPYFSKDINSGVVQLFTCTIQNSAWYIYMLTIGIISSLAQKKVMTIKPRFEFRKKEPLSTSVTVAPRITEAIPIIEQPANTQFFTVEYNINDFSQNKDGDVLEVLSSVVYFMCRNFKSYSALGFIYNPTKKAFILNSFHSKSLNVLKNIEIPLGVGPVGKIGTERRSFMSGDYSFYSPDLGYYSGAEEIHSILAVPIISDESELLGALVIDSIDKNMFKEQDKEILKRFSALAAALIFNTRMRVYQERATATFMIYYEASHQFTTALSLDEVFNVLFQVVPKITPCTRQMAIIYNENDKSGIITRIEGTETEIPLNSKFTLNNGIYSFVLKNRKLVYVQDYRQYEGKYFRFFPNETPNPNVRSLIIFPVLDDESRCRGLFSIESNQPGQFNNDIQQTLNILIENASVAFTRALLYRKMEKLATTDGLTELNNHRQFQELLSQELQRSRRYNRMVSLLLLDIDHFKSFNDTYGHPVGDLVLKEIAACISQSIRVNDIPSRYGGEEFTVILPETNEQGGMAIAERIRTTIERHTIHSLNRQLKVTVSIGCASYVATQVAQKDLIDCADKALYYSKEHGRNCVTLFRDGMSKK